MIQHRRMFGSRVILVMILSALVALSSSAAWAGDPKIAAGSSHTALIKYDGTLWAWGSNGSGQLGDGTNVDKPLPVRIGPDADWVSVAAGANFTVALKADGTLWSWGANAHGQLGNGSTTDSPVPMRIGSDTDWTAFSIAGEHALALKADGTLWAWGSNIECQIGDGSKTDRTAPVRIGSDNDWTAIAAGRQFSLALKANGTLWAWGTNNNGQLGDGTELVRPVPTLIGGDANWIALAAGNKHTIGLKADGALWAWGNNVNGQIGNGGTTDSLVPVRTGTDTDWKTIAAGDKHSAGIKTDGSLWTWGKNTYGQIGDGTVVDRLSPIRIGTTPWAAVAEGDNHTAALTANGGLWTWGSNANGQLGTGTTAGSLNPVQILYSVQTVTTGSGTISPSITQMLISGSTATFTLAPAEGYQIDSVTGCGGTLSDNLYSMATITADCTVSAVFTIKKYTITASAGPNGAIMPSGALIAAHGTVGSFTLTPDTGYRIDSVSGCSGALSGDVFTTGPITGDCTVSATFVLKTYVITASAGPNGSISPAGPVTVSHGASQSFTITPAAGYQVDQVLVDGVAVGPARSQIAGASAGDPYTYTFSTVTGAHTISAGFVATHTVTASAGQHGTLSPSGQVLAAHGSALTFTLTPDTGYRIDTITGCGGTLSGTVYTTGPIAADCTVSATFAIQTFIIAATAGANGSISPSGSVTVSYGGTQSFTATPVPGYHVDQILVDGVVVGPFRTLTAGAPLGDPYTYTFSAVTGAHTISASFAPNPSVTITASADDHGSIAPSGTSTVLSETDQYYQIRPSSGYVVSDVQVDGVSAGPVTSYLFAKVMTDHTIRATFRPALTYTISAAAGVNGSVSPSGDVAVLEGTSKTFSATPASGYKVSALFVDGANLGAFTSYTFVNITASHTISAAFSPTIVSSSGPNGTISPRGTTTVSTGSDMNYSITPTTGYHVDDVQVDGASVGSVTSYTFANVTTPHTISVTFAPNPTYIISATVTGNGTITPSGDVPVLGNTSKFFSASAAGGYKISALYVDGVNYGTVTSYTFMNVTANHTINATFSPTIVSTSGPNGTISPKGTTTVATGSDMTYTFTPNAGYHVDDVQVDAASIGAVTSYTFTNVTTPHTISVAFAPNPTYIISATVTGSGAIAPSGDVAVLGGTSSSFTATAASGYKVSALYVDGVNYGTLASYTFVNVSSNHTISAVFSPTIVSTSGPNGTISPKGTTTVAAGSDMTYTFTPNAGYHVDDVQVDGASIGAVTSYTFTNVTVPHTISVAFGANPTYIISASATGSGTITPSGDVQVLGGTSKSFSTSATSGYKISALYVDGVNYGTATSYTFVNVTANHTINATFSPTIVSTSGPNGTISPKGTTTVATGSDMTYTFTPNAGYHVDDVQVDGASIGAATSYTFTNVTVPHTISVTFGANPTYILSASATGSGTITPSGDVQVLGGTSKSFSTSATSGYKISALYVDGVNYGTATSYTFVNVSSNHTISAVFSPTIVSSSGSNGTISPRGTTTVAAGSDMTYTITPNIGYHVNDVQVDGVSIGAVTSYSFSNVTVPHTISATFAAN